MQVNFRTMANEVSVRSAVFESLHYILSADKEQRDSGEERLKVLEVTEGWYKYLSLLRDVNC